MTPQVQTLAKSIRDRLASHEGPEDAAAAIVAEWDALGMPYDSAMRRNVNRGDKLVSGNGRLV